VQDRPDRGGADLVAEAGEFAVDASITPGRVFRRQADCEGTEAGGDCGSAGSVWLGGSVARSESLVPAQDCRGRDKEAESSTGGEHTGQSGDQGSVGPPDRSSRSAPLEHSELVAQDEDLDLLGGVGSGAQHHPAQKLGGHEVDQL
jgi:hypothetical protein